MNSNNSLILSNTSGYTSLAGITNTSISVSSPLPSQNFVNVSNGLIIGTGRNIFLYRAFSIISGFPSGSR